VIKLEDDQLLVSDQEQLARPQSVGGINPQQMLLQLRAINFIPLGSAKIGLPGE
jgi:hypothetical protein